MRPSRRDREKGTKILILPVVNETLSSAHNQATSIESVINYLCVTESSQLAEPLWTDPGRMSGISMRKLIYTSKQNQKKKKKKAQAGNE